MDETMNLKSVEMSQKNNYLQFIYSNYSACISLQILYAGRCIERI